MICTGIWRRNMKLIIYRPQRPGWLPNIYFMTMWGLTILLYVLIPLESGLVSLIYNLMHLITVTTFLMMILITWRGKILQQEFKRFMWLFAVIVVVVLSAMTTEIELTWSVHISGILGFLEMLFAVFIMEYVDYDRGMIGYVFTANIVIAIIFMILSRTSFAYSGSLDSLYLGYSNPNETAIFLTLNIVVLVICFNFVSIGYRVLLTLLIVYLEYLIYLTDSRTCMVASLIVIGFSVLKKIRIPKWIIVMSLLLSLAFLFIYSGLYENGYFTDLEIMGKPFFTGRELYYLQMLEDLKTYLFVGDVGKHPFTNMHNGALTILSGIGIIGYILYIGYIFFSLNNYYKTAYKASQTVAMIAILAIYVHSISEAALIVGGVHYSIIVATQYYFLKGNSNESKQDI